jgi:hypothetical protein
MNYSYQQNEPAQHRRLNMYRRVGCSGVHNSQGAQCASNILRHGFAGTFETLTCLHFVTVHS